MSGHSKWSTIKHKKGIKDAKRGALFTKLSRDITIAAKEGGADTDMNFALRLSVDKAKEANMPKDNIERAIKRGTGEISGDEIVRVSYEAYGPEGIALIIDTTTDNSNRTVSEIKKILDSNSGKMAGPGSVAWQFEEYGLIVLSPKLRIKAEKFGEGDKFEDIDLEEVMLNVMEIPGIVDVREEESLIEVLTEKTTLQDVHKKMEELNYKVESVELVKIAKDNITVTQPEKIDKLIAALEEQEEVDAVWTNQA